MSRIQLGALGSIALLILGGWILKNNGFFKWRENRNGEQKDHRQAQRDIDRQDLELVLINKERKEDEEGGPKLQCQKEQVEISDATTTSASKQDQCSENPFNLLRPPSMNLKPAGDATEADHQISLRLHQVESQQKYCQQEEHEQLQEKAEVCQKQQQRHREQDLDHNVGQQRQEHHQRTAHFGDFHKFSREMLNALRLLLALEKIGNCLLLKIFEYGAPEKEQTETFKEYVLRTDKVSFKQYKDIFNGDHRRKIDQDPSCESFDTNLLFLAVQRGCNDLADFGKDSSVWLHSTESLENHIKRIKDKRNEFVHNKLHFPDSDFILQLEELRALFEKTLRLTEKKYKVEPSDIDCIISDMYRQLNKIRDTPFSDIDLADYKSTLSNALEQALEDKGIQDLQRVFDTMTDTNPASIITGYHLFLKVDQIFTSLKVVGGGREEFEQDVTVNNFLEYAEQMKRDKVILFEGVAGCGKTTFIKMLLFEWMSGRRNRKCIVKKLDRFSFVIPFQCRNRGVSSLSTLISNLMPNARRLFQNEKHMMECLFHQPTLIIVDGLDEMNDRSRKVFDEIVELRFNTNITVIFMTRPEKIKEFYGIMSEDMRTFHIKIDGIPQHLREVFLHKYLSKLSDHEGIKNLGATSQDAEGLIHYFSTRGVHLQVSWTLPINLTHLSVLWLIDSQKVSSITTSIELRYHLHELTINRLIRRLQHSEMTKNLSHYETEKKIKGFLAELYVIALSGIRDSTTILCEETVQYLKEHCVLLGLPSDELLGSFLTPVNSWQPSDHVVIYSYGHKSSQEFFGCMHIYNQIVSQTSFPNQGSHRYSNKSFLSYIANIFSKNNLIFKVLESVDKSVSHPQELLKYQNTIALLIGLFYMEGKEVEEDIAKELVELLARAGVTERDQWIEVLNSTRCTEMVAKLIAGLPGIMGGTVMIQDFSVSAYMNLFRHVRPGKINIAIFYDIAKCLDLKTLLKCIGENSFEVENLQLNQLFKNPADTAEVVDEIQVILERCKVVKYWGRMTPDTHLLPTMEHFGISVPDTDAMESLQWNLEICTLKGLNVCLPVTFDLLFELKPFPGSITFLGLVLPDVTTEEDLCRASILAKELQPIDGQRCYTTLRFPRSALGPNSIEKLLVQLDSVRVSRYIVFPTSSRPGDDATEKHLQSLTKKTLDCPGGIVWGSHPERRGYLQDVDTW